VTQHLRELGVDAHSAPTNALLLEKLIERTPPADSKKRVVAFFTNGSFDGIIAKYVESAKTR
jgi:UDP-N-acetylmuramate: L-alanyl-gamma-D-glutamyl-meso-diaminopimelate ligase